MAVELLHVGTAATLPRVHLPQIDGWTWTTKVIDGDVVEGILQAAAAGPADLLVLATEGRRGFLDALRGSTTERVVRGAPAVQCLPCRPLDRQTPTTKRGTSGQRWTLSAGQLIDIVKWNLLRHIPVKMRGGRR